MRIEAFGRIYSVRGAPGRPLPEIHGPGVLPGCEWGHTRDNRGMQIRSCTHLQFPHGLLTAPRLAMGSQSVAPPVVLFHE